MNDVEHLAAKESDISTLKLVETKPELKAHKVANLLNALATATYKVRTLRYFFVNQAITFGAEK